MLAMSEYLTKLEGFPDLEVGIIRKTKINKVLKAILKLDSIPRENEFKFKPRSQTMLEKWTKLLAAENTPTNSSTQAVNGSSEPAEPKPVKEPTANGVTQDGEVAAQSEDVPKEKSEESEEKPKEEPKDQAKVSKEELMVQNTAVEAKPEKVEVEEV